MAWTVLVRRVAMPLSDGQVLDGKYVIGRRLGDGGMSIVYLGVNERIGKEVAVKVLNAALLHDEDVIRRFQLEARIVSRIRSPYVADVFDYGSLDTGEPFMVMEYLEGESLAAIIERERTIPQRTVGTMAQQILQGLSAAHRSGVIHRDLKPENIIVTTRGKDVVVKIVDFGISKVIGGDEVRKTADGAVLGTPLYMSPEQARGATLLIDQRTDLYSLGVMLYEAIAGEPPLMGENVNDLLFRVALDEPTPLIERVPSVDPGFAAIVTKAMAKDVTQRYQSADEMLEALIEWNSQFLSGSQSIVPAARPATNVRSAVEATTEPVPVLTPMTLSAPSRRDEAKTTSRYTSPFARARKLAYALPAAAVVLVLLGRRPPVLEAHDLAAATTIEAAPLEPRPVTVLVPIAHEPEPEPVKVEVKALPTAPTPYVPPAPRKPRAHVVDAGGGSGADVIATATLEPPALPEEEGTPLLTAPIPIPAQD